MKKTCNTCGTSKTFDDFSKNKSKKDGLNCECKECRKIYIKNHYKENKDYYKKKAKQQTKNLRVWLRGLKIGLVCEKCGEDHPACIEYHHKDPEQKDFQISKAAQRGLGKEKILEEIAKCLVVCSNCHRKIHWETKTGPYKYMTD
jgi:hypothetical protein